MEAKKLNKSHESMTFEHLRKFIRKAATSRLLCATKNTSFAMREIEPGEDFSYDHWIAAIVVSATTIRVHFRVHFRTRSVREFLVDHQVLAKEVDPRVCHDFVREYCNLTAGVIKKGIECLGDTDVKDLDPVVNLPDQWPAFDQINSLPKSQSTKMLDDSWAFSKNTQEIFCSVKVEVLDWSKIGNEQIADLSSILITDEGVVEYL